MKLVIISVLTLCILSTVFTNKFSKAVENREESNENKIVPVLKPLNEHQKYRTKDVFDRQDKEGTFSFFPYLDEFPVYSAWYRKDSKKKPEDQMKTRIEKLKQETFNDKHHDVQNMAKNKQVYDVMWLLKQYKLARLVELDDLLNKDKSSKK